MAEFLVVAPEPVTWSLAVPAFADAMTARWPDAGVRGWGDGAHLAASAWLRAASGPWDDLLVELHPDGCTIGVDVRSYDAAAEVAAWWRGVVPAEVPVLWLFDRSFVGFCELRPGVTPAGVFPTAR